MDLTHGEGVAHDELLMERLSVQRLRFELINSFYN